MFVILKNGKQIKISPESHPVWYIYIPTGSRFLIINNDMYDLFNNEDVSKIGKFKIKNRVV